MKKIILAAAIFVGGLAFNKPANAQVNFNIGVNIGSQPDWGPVGYDRAAYYYLPDIDTYYSVPTHEFVYLNGNRWVHANSLPSRYRNYDLYNSYKVVVNDRNPWERASTYRNRYANFKGRHGQTVIRDSRDVKYKNHWNGNSRTVKTKTVVVHRDNGRHNGWDNGRGNNGHGHGHGH